MEAPMGLRDLARAALERQRMTAAADKLGRMNCPRGTVPTTVLSGQGTVEARSAPEIAFQKSAPTGHSLMRALVGQNFNIKRGRTSGTLGTSEISEPRGTEDRQVRAAILEYEAVILRARSTLLWCAHCGRFAGQTEEGEVYAVGASFYCAECCKF